MGKKFQVVLYLNQFFGQIGGEDKAGTRPLGKDGAVGPGILLQEFFGQDAEVVGTVICGDNYFNEHPQEAKEELLELIKGYGPDLLLAGPAFNAGRYGIACGAICSHVSDQMGIPCVTGMFHENAGVELYKRSTYIIETRSSLTGMKDAVKKMVSLVMKLVRGEQLISPKNEGYIPKGVRLNYHAEKKGAARAVDMLLGKLKGEPFTTEYSMPVFDRVEVLPPIDDLSETTLALITSGGIVPKGNPDHIEVSSATRYGKYSIQGVEKLNKDEYETAHGGYDPTYANEDPHRVLPLDVTREMEKEGMIGRLYPYYYSTVGNGTSVNNAKEFAKKIVKDLISDGVRAVILSST